jgi:hypothetical protein
MITFKNLQEIMEKTVDWERKLNDLYEVAQFGVKNQESKKLISFLKERQDANLEVLEGIDVKKYGPSEFVKFVDDYRGNELIPNQNIHRDSTPEEIFATILEYEEKLEKFYGMIADQVNSESQRDLFESLQRFKEGQTDRIKNFVRAG